MLDTVGTEGTQLSIPADALPCSLQRLRLTQGIDNYASDNLDETIASSLLRDFASLNTLQQLHLTVDNYGQHFWPTG